MLNKLYEWKYTRHWLIVFYFWLAFCAPWYPAAFSYYSTVQQHHSKSSEELSGSDLFVSEDVLSDSEKAYHKYQTEKCAKSYVCRIAIYHNVLVVDRTFDDPVALFTVVLAFSTIGLWFQTWLLAKGAEKEGALARDDFVSTHRPWVGFSAEVTQNGLRVDQTGLTFSVAFRCRNTGTTPAIGVSANAKAYLWTPLDPHIERQKEICQSMHAPLTNPLQEEGLSFLERKKRYMPILTSREQNWMRSLRAGRI